MPSSMIFVGLVVMWLLILVPAVARHRQEVARPSMAALSGRVLERTRLPESGRDPVRGRRESGRRERGRDVEVDVRDEAGPRAVATCADPEEPAFVPTPRRAAAVDPDPEPADAPEPHELSQEGEDADDHRPAVPRYRRGRGGFDAEAAALSARARYAFRQRVVLAMLVAVVATAVAAVFVRADLWWAHGAVDLLLVGYLVYLRRQVRFEESIRRRRAARMSGTRRAAAADGPELDTWGAEHRDGSGRHGHDSGGHGSDGHGSDRGAGDRGARGGSHRHRREGDGPDGGAHGGDGHDGDGYGADGYGADGYGADGYGADGYGAGGYGADEYGAGRRREPDGTAAGRPDDDLGRERTGRQLTGAHRDATADPGDAAPALPRLQPAPPPPLPAGTVLVEGDEDDAALDDLGVRLDHRRASGE